MNTFFLPFSAPDFPARFAELDALRWGWVLESPTRCEFQGVLEVVDEPGRPGWVRWVGVKDDPLSLHARFLERPRQRYKLCLTAGTCRAYSRARLGNCGVRFYLPDNYTPRKA